MAFRGPLGLASVKMTTKISSMIYTLIEKKRFDKNEDLLYDIFVLTKTVPKTFTEKYYANVSQPFNFEKAAAKNFQHDLAKKIKIITKNDSTP